jgi:hypothetical protein
VTPQPVLAQTSVVCSQAAGSEANAPNAARGSRIAVLAGDGQKTPKQRTQTTVVQSGDINCEDFVRIEGAGGFPWVNCASVAAVEKSNHRSKRGKFMQRTFIGATAVAALTLTGISAHASCADPRTATQQGAFFATPPLMSPSATGGQNKDSVADGIVGTWHVSYTVEGAPFAEAFIQWHSDGTEWENISLPTLSGNICMGEWKAVDKTHVFRNHVGWLFTNGTVSGFFTETETDELSRDGNSYSGTNDQKIYNLEGVLQAEVTGTSTAKRFRL